MDINPNIYAFLGHFGPKSSASCPFFGLSYFDFKCFAVFRTCNIICIFGAYARSQIDDTIHAHKKMKIIRLPNLAKCYHFVIILLSSRGLMDNACICMTSFSMRRATITKFSC